MWRAAPLVACLAGPASLVASHPVNLECTDPRFDAGYQAMHVPITQNHRDTAISLTADTYSYTAGSTVHITVRANGSKFVNEPYGVYVALRALPRLGYAGQYGVFSDLVGGLNHTKGDCPNQVVSLTAFTGAASMSWTAGPETYEDVEITMLWGNGVGPDDPLAPKFANITHAFLYSRTIRLQGPPMPSYPPVLGATSSDDFYHGATAKCVAPAESRYNAPGSPVFVQTLRAFPAKSITFPAGRCISCRADQSRCSSARVDCPEQAGAAASESLFSSSDCSGAPTSVVKLPLAFAYCPGLAYHSPEGLDLERFVHKLQRDHRSYFANETVVRGALAEYRRMLQLIQRFPDTPVVPSKLVDLVWHEHILDTATYKKDSQRLFGRYIHHAPAFGDDENVLVKAEKEGMLEDQQSMFEKYVELFEDEPRRDVWPTAARRGLTPATGHLPDCCKALCVKPDCSSCVGCNAVKCGKAEEAAPLLTSRRPALEVLPEHAAGYVPLATSLLQRLGGAVEQHYLCEAAPMPGMNFAWTIQGDHIYMKQSLVKREAWYAVGFSDVAPFDMSYADFIVTMFNHNYSWVRDLYKYDKGNNYPCWDVLSQCSLNGTVGTMDLADRMHKREGGVSESSWTRKLVTGDYKDSPITEATKNVLFATGVSDAFTFHGKEQSKSCKINFFTGEVDCGKAYASSDSFV